MEELEALTYHPNFHRVWNQASNQVHKKNQRQNSGHIFGNSVLLKRGTFPTDVASNGAFPHFATLGFGNQFRHLPVGMTLRWTPWFFLSLRIQICPKNPKFPLYSYDLVMGLRSSILPEIGRGEGILWVCWLKACQIAEVCEQKLGSTGRLLCGGNFGKKMGEWYRKRYGFRKRLSSLTRV